MARKEFIPFLNHIYALCSCLDHGLCASPAEINRAVSKYRIGKKAVPYSSYDTKVENGCLFLNGDFILRIEPLIRPFMIDDEKADYYESRCIRDDWS